MAKSKKKPVSINSKRKAIERCLQKLADKNGILTPDMVVEEAKNPNSPLHSEFEWDVDKAARSYWVQQARHIISSVKVIYRTQKTTYKSVAYVRDPNLGKNQGYLQVKNVRTQEEQSREVLVSEFERAAGILRRVQDLAKIFDLETELEQLLDRLNLMSTDVRFKKAA